MKPYKILLVLLFVSMSLSGSRAENTRLPKREKIPNDSPVFYDMAEDEDDDTMTPAQNGSVQCSKACVRDYQECVANAATTLSMYNTTSNPASVTKMHSNYALHIDNCNQDYNACSDACSSGP